MKNVLSRIKDYFKNKRLFLFQHSVYNVIFKYIPNRRKENNFHENVQGDKK